MGKVVLSGYYGFDNIGDEAILYSIIRALKNTDPAVQITVLSHNPKRTEELYRVNAVNRWQFGAVVGALKRCDLLISGGGSLLQDVTGVKSLGYYLGVITLARMLGRPVFFYAQGIGPVNSGLGRQLMRAVVNGVQAVTVRDEQSKQDLLAMGVNRPPITVTADPVLSWQVSPAEREQGKEILAGLGIESGRPVLGVSVRRWSGDTAAFKTALAAACDCYAEQGWQVVFLPLHHPGDVTACKEIAGLMHNPAVVVENSYPVRQFMGIIANCEMVVGMRLHAVIMAAAAGVPPVGISYDPKIDRFLQQLDLTPACHVNDRQCDILPQMQKITADLAGERQRLAAKVEILRQKAASTAKLALAQLR